ncbi:hypothetical protein [Caproicibacterium sp. XB1]|uniref:hypothetical protein n=1 Tax=Caproicibacterium sp. XB1 TaxID=3396405 RepID=UPI0039B6F343
MGVVKAVQIVLAAPAVQEAAMTNVHPAWDHAGVAAAVALAVLVAEIVVALVAQLVIQDAVWDVQEAVRVVLADAMAVEWPKFERKTDMQYKLKVEENLLNYLEALIYEFSRTKEIVAYMLDNNFNTASDSFKQWEKDNQKAYAEYSHAKEKMTREIIPALLPEIKGKPFQWEVDFYNKEVVVDVPQN